MNARLFSDSPGVMLAAFGEVINFQTLLEYSAYIAMIILVTVVATLWISGNRATLRRSDGRPDESRRRTSWRSLLGLGESKRRRRRAHRRRNPTLAETGGLPPVRPDSSSAATERYDP